MPLTLSCAGTAILQSAYFVVTCSRKNIPTGDLPPTWQMNFSLTALDDPMDSWVIPAAPPTPAHGTWNASTTYGLDNTVASPAKAIINAAGTVLYQLTYRSMTAGNVGHNPDNWDGWWTCMVQVPTVINDNFQPVAFAYALNPLPTKTTLPACVWKGMLWHSLFWDAIPALPPGDVGQLLDVYVLLNYLVGGQIVRLLSRPLSASVSTGFSTGNIYNPGINAQFQCWRTRSLSDFPELTLSNFEPKIVDGMQPGATAGETYLSSIVASGGTPPYAYGIVAGSLPPGVMLDPSTGVISGTPTVSGTFQFTARVTDSTGATAQVTCGVPIECPAASSPVGNAFY